MGSSPGRTLAIAAICVFALLAGAASASGLAVKPSSLEAMSANPNLKHVEIARRIPTIVIPGSTELVLRRDSGEHRSRLKSWRVNWRSPDEMKLKFGWSTKQPGVASAVWQVSTAAFGPGAKNALDPPGLVCSGPAPLPQGGAEAVFYIDLAEFAPSPSKGPAASGSKPSTNTPAAQRIDLQARPPAVEARPGADVGAAGQPGLHGSATRIRPPIKGLTAPAITSIVYYVRVVTLDAKGKCLGTPSDTVDITYGEPKTDTTVWYGDSVMPPPSNLPKVHHPTARVLRYQPLRQEASDAMYRFVVVRELPMMPYKVGQKLNFSPHKNDKSWWESLGDFISDVVSFVSDAVNWVAAAYNDIKAFAIDSMVGVLGEWSRGPLTAGLDIALAAMGVPPTLPNFDQLTSMGKEYLVAAAADYAGLPPDQVGKAVDLVIEKAKEASNGGGNPSIWLKPDPDYYYRPAYLEIEVSNPTQQVTGRVVLSTIFTVPSDDGIDLFKVPNAFVPRLQPGQKMKIPIFLREYTACKMLDTNPYEGISRFWSHYGGSPALVSVGTYGSSDTQNPYKSQHQFVIQKCTLPFTPP